MAELSIRLLLAAAAIAVLLLLATGIWVSARPRQRGNHRR